MARPGSSEFDKVRELLAPLTKRRVPNCAVVPKHQDHRSDNAKVWRVYCGEGRFAWKKGNGLVLHDGIALNFQAVFDTAGMTSFEAGVFWQTG